MTLDEFLDDYVPRVLKPMGGWHAGEAIRRRGTTPNCPLTASFDEKVDRYMDCGLKLGLSCDDVATIAISADWDDSSEPRYGPIRARLLAGLGLTEPRA